MVYIVVRLGIVEFFFRWRLFLLRRYFFLFIIIPRLLFCGRFRIRERGKRLKARDEFLKTGVEAERGLGVMGAEGLLAEVAKAYGKKEEGTRVWGKSARGDVGVDLVDGCVDLGLQAFFEDGTSLSVGNTAALALLLFGYCWGWWGRG